MAVSEATVSRVPSSAEAAIVFLVIVVPGFLYLGGYRLGRAVPEHHEGIATVAKVIAISSVIAVIAWKLGGRDLYDDALAGTALTTDEGDTWRFVIALLAVPAVVGFIAGEVVDAAARHLGEAQDRRRQTDDQTASRAARSGAKLLDLLSARLLHEGPSTWDRTWRQMRRSEPYVFVRVRTKSGQIVVGTMTDRSRVALTPQPRDLYIDQVLLEGPDGNYYPTNSGLGVRRRVRDRDHRWVSHKGLVNIPHD